VEPRFPIMGGWKSNFNLGYNLPTKFQATTDGKDNYNLTLRFGIPFDDVLAKNYTMRLVMPDGASNIKVCFIIYFYLFYFIVEFTSRKISFD
jgi:oligosaccharyltransferase complex subunit alpha (ribophorin I)